MALVQETGAGTEGGNSYVSVSDIRAFVGTVELSSATDAQLERAAILATRYLDGKYRARFKGVRTSSVQPLEWPRLHAEAVAGITPGAYIVGREPVYYAPSSQIPQEIKDAVCELALRALSGPLAADIAPSDRVSRDKVGPIETEYTARDFTTCYQVVDQLVSRWLRNPNEAVRA